jgi:hypothetical protein
MFKVICVRDSLFRSITSLRPRTIGGWLRSRKMDEHKQASRSSFPPLLRYALLAVILVVCVLGLSRAIETFLPQSGSGSQLPLLVTSGPAIIPEDYMGVPRPMLLEVAGQTQTAAVGAYCWISAKNGTQFKQTCADFTGLPTPRQPLKIGSPSSARLRSPFPATPQSLSLLIMSLGASDQPIAQTATTLTWKLKPGQVQSLRLQPEPQFELVLPDGLYAFSLQAAWPDLGTVNYGFLVQIDHAIPTPTVQIEPPMPTAPPAPTAVPPTAAPGETASPAEPEGSYATQQAIRETAISARATASPFPTAPPVSVQSGSPAGVTAQRGGLSLQVSLPKDEFVAGEGGLAQITLRNDGPEALFIDGDGRNLAGITLLDAQGRPPDPWPYSWFWMMSGPPYLIKLEPGQQVDATLQFQIPPGGQNPAPAYTLWAETRFSRVDPFQSEGPDNLWLRLESGPLALKITPPQSSNRLKVDFTADQSGWQLKVSSAAGGMPPGPLWGEIGATSTGATNASPLKVSSDGTASGAWSDGMFKGNDQLLAGGWVAAQGYVTSPFSLTVPGQAGDFTLPDLAPSSPPRKTFTSLEQAQASLAVPLARLPSLPSGASIASVQVTWDGTDRMTIEQRFRLANGQWLILNQYLFNPADDYGGWGQARYDFEAQPVKVNGGEAYAAFHNGWLRLDWRANKAGFELSAPTGALSLADLLNLAASVQ